MKKNPSTSTRDSSFWSRCVFKELAMESCTNKNTGNPKQTGRWFWTVFWYPKKKPASSSSRIGIWSRGSTFTLPQQNTSQTAWQKQILQGDTPHTTNWCCGIQLPFNSSLSNFWVPPLQWSVECTCDLKLWLESSQAKCICAVYKPCIASTSFGIHSEKQAMFKLQCLFARAWNFRKNQVILAPFFFFGDLGNFPQLTAKNVQFMPLDKKIPFKSQHRKMPAQPVKPCPSTAHFLPTLLAHSHF